MSRHKPAPTSFMESKMTVQIVVTSHTHLLQYLIEEGIVSEEARVVRHATPEAITGRHVICVLPHSLACFCVPNPLTCLCASFTEISLFIPSELRGKELTLEQIREFAGKPSTYEVRKIR